MFMTALEDSEIERILFVTAHPDDLDFGAGGTIAQWTAKGIKVSYCICTNGDQGGIDPAISRDEMRKTRQREQLDAGKELGVTDVHFLNYHDGLLEPTIQLRKDIVRVIRKVRPQRLVCQSPIRNFERAPASHPDHIAAAEAAMQAMYPDCGNQFAFPDLLSEEGLEPWSIKETWVMTDTYHDHHVDITDTFDRKLAALRAHVSQTAHNSEMPIRIRTWAERSASLVGLPTGCLAETFKVVSMV
jgi:LmbE family N-acetylglucosaminyl deacetylase